MPNWKQRRLLHYDYSLCGAYFVTVCTFERTNNFWENDIYPDGDIIQLTAIGSVIQASIEELQSHYPFLSIDNYVIMPNHIHFIIVFHEQVLSLSTVINQWKGYITRKCGTPIFQRSFHDRIIRNADEYEKIWNYIEDNPRKWNEDEYWLG